MRTVALMLIAAAIAATLCAASAQPQPQGRVTADAATIQEGPPTALSNGSVRKGVVLRADPLQEQRKNLSCWPGAAFRGPWPGLGDTDGNV